MYRDLTQWYDLIDPRSDHADEGAVYGELLAAAARGRPGSRPTLLELGAGAGNNAWYLKSEFDCTLTDLSPGMLALSRLQNPECEHIEGDMRTLRLNRQFDAVLIHDAIVYMTSESDLADAVSTAYVHTRPGGTALFAPDATKESFTESTHLIGADDGDRSLRGIEWSWDPDPDDTEVRVEYALVTRAGGEVRSFLDRHVEGLFPVATWQRLLSSAGFDVEQVDRTVTDASGNLCTDRIFRCNRRP